VEWSAPGLTVVLAWLASVIGAELVRASAVHKLDGLRAAHWTERARVFTDTINTVRLFRGYLITLTTMLVMFGVPDLGPQRILRFGAAVALAVTLLGDPGAARWVRRATAGGLTPSSWREAQSFALLMFPSRWLLIGVVLLAPQRYDAYGWVWAGTSLVALGVAQAGGGAVLCRALGLVRLASEEMRALVASVAQAASIAAPPVYELKLSRVNAMALPTLGWIIFTSAAVQQLEPAELSVIAAHELGHLREPFLAKLARIGAGVSIFSTIGFMPAFPEAPFIGLAYGCGLFVIVALGMRTLSVRLERRADALAHDHQQDPGAYAAALERVYQLNWIAAGVVNRTHPSLHERMERAGVQPNYARPQPSARGPKLLALAFGAVISIALAFIVCPILAHLFG
jgi:Zn-dependent protease with chaperone function